MMNEEDLERQLAKWEIDLPEDSGFRASVWREISLQESSSLAAQFYLTAERLFRPKLWVPAAISVVVAVMLTASLHGLRSREKTWENPGVAYNGAIDPISLSDGYESP